MLDSLWSWLTSSPPIFWAGLAIGFLLGLLSAVSQRLWRHLRFVATWVHESGHALAAIVLGRDVTGIAINRDTSGVTNSVGRRSRGEQAIVTFMGYPAPAIFSAILLFCLISGSLHIALFLIAVVPVLMLLLQRSALGLIITAGAMAFAVLLLMCPPEIASLLSAALAGYLFVASPRTVFELRHHRKARRSDDPQHSDADTLAALTYLPAPVWEAIFLSVSILLPAIAVLLALRQA